MSARLATAIEVNALIRRVEARGGHGAVLAKGDPNAGALLLILRERAGIARFFERTLSSDGRYIWRWIEGQDAENDAEVSDFVSRRRRIDPDLWALELDIAGVERFAAEIIAGD